MRCLLKERNLEERHPSGGYAQIVRGQALSDGCRGVEHRLDGAVPAVAEGLVLRAPTAAKGHCLPFGNSELAVFLVGEVKGTSKAQGAIHSDLNGAIGHVDFLHIISGIKRDSRTATTECQWRDISGRASLGRIHGS